jgi:two-component system, NtrC family, nitrogen regulation response regulator GlnG
MTSSRRVFVIDDSEIARELVTMILEEHGLTVESSDSPFELGSRLTRFQPAVILLDLRMPGLTEEKLPAVVASFRSACRASVVLHTAHDRVEVMRLVQHGGADGYIEKSDDDEQFVERLTQWLERH